MSLLLEALKKAELAKQQGTATQPPDGVAADPGAAGLTLEPASADPGGERPLPMITRDRLPDITQPLEILSEDLPSASARREPPATSAAASQPLHVGAEGTVAAAAERAGRAATAPDPEEPDRLSARQLFEAKDTDYNPRRPFFLMLGVLGLVAVGGIGYLLWQLYSPPRFYAPIAAKSAPITPPAAAPGPTTAPSTTVAAAPAVPAALQPAPATGAAGPQAGDAMPRPARPAAPAAAPADPEPAPRRAAPAAPEIRVTRPEPRIEPGLERAWRALDGGNLPLAKEEYLRVLAAFPLDRDALLGLATIDARSQDYEGAEARYLKVLELDPRDPYALAGLIALRGGADPVQAESRLKNLLALYPDAPLLHSSLGNLYAVQARWSDAQAAYFKAFSGDPENPDYAYNLAVSLDQLHQPKVALEYYRRALALAANRAVGFNRAQAEARVRELAH